MENPNWAEQLTAWATVAVTLLALLVAWTEGRRYRLARSQENDRVMRDLRAHAAHLIARRSGMTVTITNTAELPFFDVTIRAHGVTMGPNGPESTKPVSHHHVGTVDAHETRTVTFSEIHPTTAQPVWTMYFTDHDLQLWFYRATDHYLTLVSDPPEGDEDRQQYNVPLLADHPHYGMPEKRRS